MLLSSRDISITCCWTSLLISSWKAGDTAAIGRCEFGLNKDGWSKSSSGGDGGFHAFHIIHVRRRLHRRASCHQAATPATHRHHLIQNGFKHRFARSQRRVLVLHFPNFPTSFRSSHKSLCQMAKNPSRDPSTIKNLSNRFEAKVFVRVCKPSEHWAMFKALGRRSYPRFLFFCL